MPISEAALPRQVSPAQTVAKLARFCANQVWITRGANLAREMWRLVIAYQQEAAALDSGKRPDIGEKPTDVWIPFGWRKPARPAQHKLLRLPDRAQAIELKLCWKCCLRAPVADTGAIWDSQKLDYSKAWFAVTPSFFGHISDHREP
jgi:hypothetical protein